MPRRESDACTSRLSVHKFPFLEFSPLFLEFSPLTGEHKKVGASRFWTRIDPELKNPAFEGWRQIFPIRRWTSTRIFMLSIIAGRPFYCWAVVVGVEVDHTQGVSPDDRFSFWNGAFNHGALLCLAARQV
jgi:hypothetical protein